MCSTAAAARRCSSAARSVLRAAGAAHGPPPRSVRLRRPASDSHYQLLLNLVFEGYQSLSYLDPDSPPEFKFHRFASEEGGGVSGCYGGRYERKVGTVEQDCTFKQVRRSIAYGLSSTTMALITSGSCQLQLFF